MVPMEKNNLEPSVMGHDCRSVALVDRHLLVVQLSFREFPRCFVVSILVGWLQRHASTVLFDPAFFWSSRYNIFSEAHGRGVEIF